MIFWILLGLAIAATVATFIYQYADWGELGMSFAGAFLSALVSFVVGALFMLLLSIWFGPTATFKGESDHDLVALQSSQSIQGRSYFLGSGYINGIRTLNYITDDNGAFRVESANAANAVVFQDSDNPTVTVHQWSVENPWFAPWSFGHTRSYTFHVPEGSILSDYTIDNE